VAYRQLGRTTEAAAWLKRALAVEPRHADAQAQLAYLELAGGNPAAAIRWFRAALRVRSPWPDVANDLAWVLATSAEATDRDGAEALRLARQVCAKGGQPSHLDTLAAACAEVGRYDQAAQIARQAHDKARSSGQHELAAKIASRLKLYEQGQAYRQVFGGAE